MESSVLVHQCTFQNIDLVAAFFLLVVMKHSLPAHSSVWNFGLLKIVSVFNRDGKFTPIWLKQFLEFCTRLISLAHLYCIFSPPCWTILSRIIQAVVRIWGLCKLSVFLFMIENSLIVC